MTWMIRDLVRIKCYIVFSGVELPLYKLPDVLYARETDLWLPAGFWLLESH